jgi:hypothetical protein
MIAPVRRLLCAAIVLLSAARLGAHDAERTEATLTFARDGAFTLDVSNDPNWLAARMAPFHGNFIDRIVLFVDGHEVRPTSVEFLPPRTEDALATYRLRGRMPTSARNLRWYYGLVADPYRLTIARADGRVQVEQIAGDAWSRPIDLSGQFVSPLRAAVESQLPLAGLVALFAVALTVRFRRTRAGVSV